MDSNSATVHMMHFNKISLFLFACLAGVHAQNRGDATYYTTGLGSCGWQSVDTDYIVALSPSDINNGNNCGKHIEVSYRGKTIDATTVDTCPECTQGSIDLSPSAFQALAPLDAGRIQVQWNWA